MLLQFAMLGRKVAGAAPTGPPTNVVKGFDGLDVVITWTAGDVTARSIVYRGALQVQTVEPGVTELNTGLKSGTFFVSHIKNGQETALVEAI